MKRVLITASVVLAGTFALLDTKLPDKLFSVNDKVEVGDLLITLSDDWQIHWLRSSSGVLLYKGYLPNWLFPAVPNLSVHAKFTATSATSADRVGKEMLASYVPEPENSASAKQAINTSVQGISAIKTQQEGEKFATYYFKTARAKITTDVALEIESSVSIRLKR